MNSPIKIKNLTLDGTWQALQLNREYIAMALQARGDNALLVAQPGESALYYTVKSGSSLDLSTGNFLKDDTLLVKGTVADVAELLGFVRA